MSFSKAKIQRFNDIKVCTPSPAKYNACFIDKTKHVQLLSKSHKKGENQPSESGSVHSTPCFQTPTTIPKKKKLLGLSFRSGKVTDAEELREKIVECNNKDMYIRDLIEQIEEMTGKINVLEREKTALAGESDKLATLHVYYINECTKFGEKAKELKRDVCKIRETCKKSFDFEKVKLLVGQFEKVFEEAKNDYGRKEEQIKKKLESMKKCHLTETEEMRRKLEEKEAKIKLLEENFTDVNALTDIQMKQKIEEVEAVWECKLQAKEKESEAILKECQAISEYSIIQSEIEKNRFKSQYEELVEKQTKLAEEVKTLKSEKHAYELSITTFRDTIEVLKKRLFSSDRDVIQLKEELEKCENRIICFEKKCTELADQLAEAQNVNEELEMQYESTSKIMQSQVEAMKVGLLDKVEALMRESKQLSGDKKLLSQVMEQHRDQQALIARAQETITQSAVLIEALEVTQHELEARLANETEEGAEIRKKYIETSGKYDALAQQFEQLLQQFDMSKSRIEQLEQQVENATKKRVEVVKPKVKTSELFEKNMDLEAANYKLKKTIDKLKLELDGAKKHPLKREDKENVASPKCLKGAQSPGPLKDRN